MMVVAPAELAPHQEVDAIRIAVRRQRRDQAFVFFVGCHLVSG
jgi:hypothetical protein